jgi:hypothetical protein
MIPLPFGSLTLLRGRILDALLRHVGRLGAVKRHNEIIGCLRVETESIAKGLQLGRLLEVVLFQSITTSMEVLFNCVEAHIQDSRLRGGKVLLKLQKLIFKKVSQ